MARSIVNAGDGCLRIDEVCRLLGLGRTKVYELMADGSLPSAKIGRARRVPGRAVEEFLRRRMSRQEC